MNCSEKSFKNMLSDKKSSFVYENNMIFYECR
jgi:hypothetical protein